MENKQRVQRQKEGDRLGGYWSNWASRDDGLEGVAVVDMKGRENGVVTLLMHFKGRATGFMKGLNGNFH